jgi:LCP family protein required for cell wall assembly
MWRRIERVHVDMPGSPAGGTTYLLVGSDSREFAQSAIDRSNFGTERQVPGERADIVALVRVRHGRRTVLTIPRDLVVLTRTGAAMRLANTLQRGTQVLVDSLCGSLGLGVDRVAVLHFDGLRRLVDEVGGVGVQTPTRARDVVTGLELRAGRNRLDGVQALAYVRSRHLEYLRAGQWVEDAPDANARSERARTVLAQLGARLDVSPLHPLRSLRAAWRASGALTLDDDASPLDVRRFAHALADLDGARQIRLPVRFHPDEIPTAELTGGASRALKAFDGGKNPDCSRPELYFDTARAAARPKTGATP